MGGGRCPEKEEGILRRKKKKLFTLFDNYDDKEVEYRRNRIKRKRGNSKRIRRGRRRERRMWWGRKRMMTWERKRRHNKEEEGLEIYHQFV